MGCKFGSSRNAGRSSFQGRRDVLKHCLFSTEELQQPRQALYAVELPWNGFYPRCLGQLVEIRSVEPCWPAEYIFELPLSCLLDCGVEIRAKRAPLKASHSRVRN